ncbi:sensor histidine kinase [Mycolicibacterium alvei]|uniref:histidine kinase n=1 Tax=Mycolicibacterium alvei TaxID=67081 RepID=A0A6N4URK0_9MYCO|nr:ATP-binding protein [Mycolicibacterium alvei]MCV7003761.1 HAMP domain-containing protein [Mycolicibacterium alvei]BBX27520.1 two-component sensor histidine kinase [Mycolicibacterium alvei]
MPPRLWGPRSLRRRLVLGVSAIVSVALFAVGALSVYSLHTYVTTMSDTEVSRSLAAFSHSLEKWRESQGGHEITADTRALTAFVGQAPGNLIAVLHDGEVIQSAVFSDGEPHPAPAEVTRALDTHNWIDERPRTVKLPVLGAYRLASQPSGTGDVLVSGVSLDSANLVIARKTVTVAVMIVIALIVTALGTIAVVRIALRPLSRVAATAAKVATLPLDGADHRITTRVRDKDTDPDTEVGLVGDTLNRLLTNVDSALAALSASDRRTRQFLTDASHELRTPLAAIQGYAELTRQDSANLPPTTEYALARIEAEARRMTGLVSDLLLLSRLGEGQELETDDIDLSDLAVDAVNDVAVGAPEHHWVAELPDDPLWVRGDLARLHQVLSNLLTNARIHTPPGVTVTIALTEAGEFAELTVTDDGPGIDSELLPNLFGRFVRADKSRSRELGSTGLGLAVVASIVQAHDGTVAVASKPGCTVFTVRIPLARAAEPEGAAGRPKNMNSA